MKKESEMKEAAYKLEISNLEKRMDLDRKAALDSFRQEFDLLVKQLDTCKNGSQIREVALLYIFLMLCIVFVDLDKKYEEELSDLRLSLKDALAQLASLSTPEEMVNSVPCIRLLP